MSLPGVLEDQVLKIHTARDGRVWYVDGSHATVNTGAPIEDFLETTACRGARHVRMVGSSGNARALCLMHGRKTAGKLLRLEVASPAVVGRTRAERDDAKLMLMRIRDSAADGLNPAMGGWHEFGVADYPAYAIAACDGQDPSKYKVAECYEAMLAAHPAWPGLAFIQHLDLGRLAQLLGVILDPRWYVSLRTPRHGSDVAPYYDDASKLHAYLGLDPRTMAGVLGPLRRERRIGAVPTGARGVVGPGYTDTGSTDAPQLFPLAALSPGRRADQGRPAGQPDVRRLPAAGLARRALLRSQRPSAGGAGMRPIREGLFAPDHFFSHGEEADAYVEHRASVISE